MAIVSSSKDNWVGEINAVNDNPYDVHPLEASLEQVKQIRG